MNFDFLKVGIVADDKTSKGINSAKKNISGLDKLTKKLGKTFATVFATQKIIAFGRAAVNAFLADQKAAAKLANTLKNLGLAFQTKGVEDFIARLSASAGIVDDVLRPAFEKLLTTTGSVIKSEDLLQKAIEISRGSGVDLETVITDLTNAYVGNTKGLKKYATGLTAAELQSMTFEQIMAKLNKQFQGSNAAYLKTYAGQLDVLKTAGSEAMEILGKGLIDALLTLSGNTSIKDLAEDMKKLAKVTAFAFKVIAKLLEPTIHRITALIGYITTAINLLKDYLDNSQVGASMGQGVEAQWNARNGRASGASTIDDYKRTAMARRNAAAAAKAEKEAAKRAKELADLKKKQLKDERAAAQAKKQSALFDMEQIQLIAALKGKLSEEDRNRVLLQLALLQGNEKAADELSQKVANSIDKTGQLAQYLRTLPDANNPFKNWDAYIKSIKEQLANLQAPQIAAPNAPAPTTTQQVAAALAQDYSGFALNMDLPSTSGSGAQFGGSTPWAQAAGTTTVNVQVDGKTIASALLDQSLSGNQAYVDRRTGGFNW